jgi:hypothetical protein
VRSLRAEGSDGNTFTTWMASVAVRFVFLQISSKCLLCDVFSDTFAHLYCLIHN